MVCVVLELSSDDGTTCHDSTWELSLRLEALAGVGSAPTRARDPPCGTRGPGYTTQPMQFRGVASVRLASYGNAATEDETPNA